MPKALKYMLNMKRLPILLLMVVVGVFLAFETMGKTDEKNPPSRYEKILQIVGQILTQGHFSPKEINDEFSRKVYNKYFEELDSEKNIFFQDDDFHFMKIFMKVKTQGSSKAFCALNFPPIFWL